VFVSLVRAYYDNAPAGKTWFADPANRQLVIDEADNLVAQLLPDGLSFSHPNGDLKYSADNCEVWRGLVDAAYLLAGDPAAVAKYASAAGRIKSALLGGEPDGFMRGSPASMAVAKKRSGRFIRAKVAETWYPDATFQLFPIYTGLVVPGDPTAQRLWASVRDNWRNGSDRDFTLGTADGWKNGVQTNPKNAYPWAMTEFVAALMNDVETVARFRAHLVAAYPTWHYPFYCMEAGFDIAANGILAGAYTGPAG
jgi:hypothetical protein